MKDSFSNIGFILASIGSAVGLGNIWRFSYMVGQNGGGSFLLAYIIANLIVGIPIMFLEIYSGKKSGGSLVRVYESVKPAFKYFAILSLISSIIIASYYIVINGWAISFIFQSFTGYTEFSQFSNSYISLIFFCITLFIIYLVLRGGISQGIEKFAKYIMPIFFILLLTLLAYSLTLDGLKEGLTFYLKPDFETLLNPKIWILAFGQTLFSLSVGLGILLTYASHFKGEITKPIFFIAISDIFIAILAGFIIFPIVFTFGIEPSAGAGLAFISFPLVFSSLGSLGMILGVLFFTLLSIAAITSSISFVQLILETISEFFNISNKMSLILSTSIILVLGSVFALRSSLIEFADIIFGTILTIICAILMTIIITWFKKIEEENKTIRTFLNIAKYVSPILLTLVLIFTFINM